MMLTGLQLKEFVSNITDDKQIQQVSIDLRLIKVEKVSGGGQVFRNQTIVNQYNEVNMIPVPSRSEIGWLLQPGFYSFTFNESLEVPKNIGMQIIQRSSLLRNGTIITSGIYDPNFKCDNIGAFANVTQPIFIEYTARVACLKGWYCDEVKDDYLYNGQWQKK